VHAAAVFETRFLPLFVLVWINEGRQTAPNNPFPCMPNVIVVPETEVYVKDVLVRGIVFINPDLGTPQLDARDARYLAPFWILDGFTGVNRVFQIIGPCPGMRMKEP
jgi:hypothetical protein